VLENFEVYIIKYEKNIYKVIKSNTIVIEVMFLYGIILLKLF